MRSQITGVNEADFAVESDLESILQRTQADVMLDFTNPHSVLENAKLALRHKVSCVIGTTGLTETEMDELKSLMQENGVGLSIIPNFAVGAVLMMKMAAEASKYLPDVEIIELHHNQKMDAPSGTAIKTAEMISQQRGAITPKSAQEYEKLTGARGASLDSVHIHSVRLPGLIAHQEVILGGLGQTLTIRHDSYDRISFMPGVLLAIQKTYQNQEFVYGLEYML